MLQYTIDQILSNLSKHRVFEYAQICIYMQAHIRIHVSCIDDYDHHNLRGNSK